MVPYRIELPGHPDDALDRLIALGALDVEPIDTGMAALIPDSVHVEEVKRSLGTEVRAVPAVGRDDGSVWVLTPREVRVKRFVILPEAGAGGRTQGLRSTSRLERGSRPFAIVRLLDAPAFGTGMHPTTAMCLAALDDELNGPPIARALDIGTGSGILALAALAAGVPRVTALDIDSDAVRAAAANARLNGMRERCDLVLGSIDAVAHAYPLVLANVLTAPLVAMAPALVRTLAPGGRLIVSGVRASLRAEVEQAYRRIGMRVMRSNTQDGWSASVLHASW